MRKRLLLIAKALHPVTQSRPEAEEEAMIDLVAVRQGDPGAGKHRHCGNLITNTIGSITEVCSIFCATANPVEEVLAKSEQGRGRSGRKLTEAHQRA
jgi:hypothetical protein